MKNKKGQALIEFVIILPVLLFVIFLSLDFGTITFDKNRMNDIMNDVIKMYNDNKSTNEIESFVKNNIKDSNITIKLDGEYIKVNINKRHNFYTPGLSKIMGENYNIEVERMVYNEIE